MRFTLYYRGPLPSNGKPTVKQELRRRFHQQLAVLWHQEPLSHARDSVLHFEETDPWFTRVGSFQFAPLASRAHGTFAELTVDMVRHGRPGEILSSGGDIDNRLKTLFDALAIPQGNALPPGDQPRPTEVPFFTLLEDDRLVSDVHVRTHQSLDPTLGQEDVVLLIQATVVPTDFAKASHLHLFF